MRSRLLPLFSALLLAALATVAQTPAPAPERRVLAVSILDKDGNPVRGLTADNFRGEFRGQPVKILSATEDTGRRRIALLIDTSASIRDHRKLVWAAARDLALSLASGNDIVLLTVQEEVQQFQPALSSRTPQELEALLSQAEAAATIGGNTALYDGMVAAVQTTPVGFADVLYVISDMVDRTSRADAGAVAAELARTGVRAYLVWFWGREEPRRTRIANRVRQRLADASGGMTVELWRTKPEKIATETRALYSGIKYIYRLEVEFPLPIDKARDWELEVVGPDGEKLKDVVVAYPRLLVPLKEK